MWRSWTYLDFQSSKQNIQTLELPQGGRQLFWSHRVTVQGPSPFPPAMSREAADPRSQNATNTCVNNPAYCRRCILGLGLNVSGSISTPVTRKHSVIMHNSREDRSSSRIWMYASRTARTCAFLTNAIELLLITENEQRRQKEGVSEFWPSRPREL